MSGGFARPYTPSLRATFIGQITEAAHALGAQLRWHPGDWVAELVLGQRRQLIVGYTFAINDSASAELAVDKAATSATLAEHGVPVVTHRVFTFGDLSVREAAKAMLAEMALPLVIKPLRASGGTDVRRASTFAELTEALGAMAVKYASIAVSPWLHAPTEYRVVWVDGSAQLVFGKTIRSADPSEWRHSSDYGAWAELVRAGPVRAALTALAGRASIALGLTVAAVDILDTTSDGMQVIEVNDAFSLNHFSQQSAAHYRQAVLAYQAILAAGFAK